MQITVLLGREDSFAIRAFVISVCMGCIVRLLNLERWESCHYIVQSLDDRERMTAVLECGQGDAKVEVKISDVGFDKCDRTLGDKMAV